MDGALCGTAPESSIVKAYRETKASRKNYPNTGELLRQVIGQEKLSGGITEIDPLKHAQLKDAWSGSCVRPINSSWRNQVRPGGVLMAPVRLSAPWLFTMDPMTYCESGDHNDDKLYRADFSRVSAAVSSFVESGQPGVAALFVYAVKPEVRPQFWAFVDDLAKETKTTPVSCWLLHQGGNRNLAALLCSSFVLPPDWLPHGLKVGR